MKQIIILKDKQNSGKTSTLKELAKLLNKNFNIEFKYTDSIRQEDVILKGIINNKKIGIISFGDIAEDIEKEIQNFKDVDLLLCASRTKGNTYKVIKQFAEKENFKLIETSTYKGDKKLNNIRAKELYKFILEIFDLNLSYIKQNLYEIDKLKPEKIVLEELKGIRGAPWRHPFMVETIKYLSNFHKEINLLEIGSFIGSSLLSWSYAGEKYLTKLNIVCIDPLSSFNENYKGGGIE